MFPKFSVKKPYAVVVAVVLVIILGVVSFQNMTVDLLPNINLPYVMVITSYPGASPEQIEQTVSKPVEESMATVSNIKKVTSTSSDNVSTVTLEFEQTANMDSAIIEIRENLDQVEGAWPDAVSSPIIMKLNPNMMPVMVSAVTMKGDDLGKISKEIDEKVLPEIESVEGVASVSTYGELVKDVRISLVDKDVDNVISKIEKKANEKINEATKALDSAKAQVASGKAALASGKTKAIDGISGAEGTVSTKAEELKQAQLEIAEKSAELASSKAQLQQAITLANTAVTASEASLSQLEELKKNEANIQARISQLNDKVSGGGTLTAAEQVELQTLTAQMQALASYASTKATLTATITQGKTQLKTLNASMAKITAGEKQLAKLKAKVNAGAITLAKARAELSKTSLSTTFTIGDASAGLIAGETTLAAQEQTAKAQIAQASSAIDYKSLITTDMIKQLLTAENFSMPAGSIKEDGEDIQVRVGEKLKDINDIKNLVIVDIDGMAPVKLSDIANVRYEDNSDEYYAKINNKKGILFQIQKQNGYSTGDVTDNILAKFKTLEKSNSDLDVVTIMNQGVYIDTIINSVLENLLFGAILAILVLLLFLKSIRPTIIIAISIPISLVAAIVAMYFSGVTLNLLSLSGLALGVGMLVDNSIVVIENIYRMRNEEGAKATKAAIEGAKQMAGAITASTLTTICVFLPIVFAKGITKQLFVDIGLTIGYSLLASLLVALTVVPMASAGILKNANEKENKLFNKIQNVYGKFLAKALPKKGIVLLLALLLFAGSIPLAMSRGTEFIPTQKNSTEIVLLYTLDKKATMSQITTDTDELIKRVRTIKDIKDIGALYEDSSGGLSIMGLGNTSSVSGKTVMGYAIIRDNPTLDSKQLQKAIEKKTKDLPGEVQVQTSTMDMSALGGSGLVVQIRGNDLDKLSELATKAKTIVSKVKGTQNVLDGQEDAKKEYKVTVNKAKAMAHNLTVAQVYQSIYNKIGNTASVTTLTTSDNEYSVYVGDSSKETFDRNDIRNMTITATKSDKTTEQVKLSSIATFANDTSPKSIERSDRTRVMSVSSEIKDGYNVGIVGNKVKKALKSLDLPEGYSIKMSGEDQTINDSMVELFKMLALAIVFMYLIMVAQFQSLRSPFIVMFTVPLAFTGGLLALFLSGKPISIIAMVGFIMLSGIIVNNGIVFIDYTNQLIRDGMERREALVVAGKTRLRPIFMTALTTVLGLLTMALGIGTGTDMVQPMAIVTIGGLIYGTILTLVVVPCIYDLFHKREKARFKDTIENDEEELETFSE